MSEPFRALLNTLGPERKNLGIILCTTKGITEDLIWNQNPNSDSLEMSDPYSPLLNLLIKMLGPERIAKRAIISNACASSHSGLILAKKWLSSEQKDFSDVLVVGTDQIGPFIQSGFRALSALSQSTCRPFSKDREGLVLGGATAAVWLTRNPKIKTVLTSEIEISGHGMDIEGHALTRPETSGASLKRAVVSAMGDSLSHHGPDFIIAHATSTQLNDLTESQVFKTLYPDVPVTATKWCIGHTLGASGLMDVIAACGVFQQRKLFPVLTTKTQDPEITSRVVLYQPFSLSKANTALVTSLGFGGVHAALKLTSRAPEALS